MTDIARERKFLRDQGLNVITREDWDAVQSYTSDRLVSEPVEGFFLHISVTIDHGDLTGDEHRDMRTIERIGQERFGIGFPYNAAIFDTGRLYEGQPLTRRGAHTVNDENQPGFRETGSHGSLNYWYRAICLPQMLADDVTDEQVRQIARWGAAQIRAGYAKRNATWHGHRDVSAKSCPGDTGYARLPEIRRLCERYVVDGLHPVPQPHVQGDGMFAYDLITNTGSVQLVICAGGKQSRVVGATVATKVRAQDYYIGQVDSQTEAWFKSTWGPVTGL